MNKREKELKARYKDLSRDFSALQNGYRISVGRGEDVSQFAEMMAKIQHEQYLIVSELSETALRAIPNKIRSHLYSLNPNEVEVGDRLLYLNTETNRYEANPIETIRIEKTAQNTQYTFITESKYAEVKIVPTGKLCTRGVDIVRD